MKRKTLLVICVFVVTFCVQIIRHGQRGPSQQSHVALGYDSQWTILSGRPFRSVNTDNVDGGNGIGSNTDPPSNSKISPTNNELYQQKWKTVVNNKTSEMFEGNIHSRLEIHQEHKVAATMGDQSHDDRFIDQNYSLRSVNNPSVREVHPSERGVPPVNSSDRDLHEVLAQLDPTSWHSNDPCVSPNCQDYLSQLDKMRMQECLNCVKQFHATPQEGQCSFMNGSQRQPVALVSYPGSGNTWVRGLLETATGICTGAIYCDMSLRANGMVGENIRSGAVLVVKAHGSNPQWVMGTQTKANSGKTHFGSAVFIVRNPLDAFVAEWTRKVANDFKGRTVTMDSHTKHAGKQWFEDERISAYEIASDRRALQRASGWKLLHFTSQLDEMSQVEGEILEAMQRLKEAVGRHEACRTEPELLQSFTEIIEGNVDRSKRVLSHIGDSQKGLLKVLDHKPLVMDMLKKYSPNRSPSSSFSSSSSSQKSRS